MATNLRSFRLDEDLIEKLDRNTNFSQLANQSIREYLNEYVWLPNLNIHNHAKITPSELIERTSKVEQLRQSESAVSFTFYPTSEEELKQNRAIYDYANGDYNALHDQYIYFNIKFPLNFLFFLRSKPWDVVEKSVHAYLAFLHWSDEDSQRHIEEQVERKTLKSVIKLTNGETFQKMNSKWKSYQKAAGGQRLRAEFNELYFKALIELGLDPLLFPFVKNILGEVHYPIHLSEVIFSKSSDFAIRLTAAYMRDIYEERDDWRLIVVNATEKNDNLQRAESEIAPWKIWFDEYTFYYHKEISTQARRSVRVQSSKKK